MFNLKDYNQVFNLKDYNNKFNSNGTVIIFREDNLIKFEVVLFFSFRPFPQFWQ